MADEEFITHYREAMARYGEADFGEFFSLAEIDDPETRSLGKDFIGAAGSFYLMQMNYQSKRASRGETIRLLRKTQKSSRAFAESLSELLQSPGVVSELAELTSALRGQYPTTADQEQDSYKILDSIFPLSANGKGFRYEGMAQALRVLAQCIEAVDEKEIKKPDTGRSSTLKGWMILMILYWVEVKGDVPRSGHYDSETAGYSSRAIAALTKAAQTLDPEISERLVVLALGAAIQSFNETDLEGTIILTRSFAALARSNEAQSPPDALRRYIGMPEDVYNKFTTETHAIPRAGKEAAIVTKEEFYETLKSSEFGKMLLQSQVEKNGD
jgi:hypothetical protein